MSAEPEFRYSDLLPLADDRTPCRGRTTVPLTGLRIRSAEKV